jgi:hypothetical protein
MRQPVVYDHESTEYRRGLMLTCRERIDRLGDHYRDAMSDTPPPVELYAAGVGFLFVGFGVVGISVRVIIYILRVSWG